METSLNYPDNVAQPSKRPCNCEGGLRIWLRTTTHWCSVYVFPLVWYGVDLTLDLRFVYKYWNSDETISVKLCIIVRVISLLVGVVYLTNL